MWDKGAYIDEMFGGGAKSVDLEFEASRALDCSALITVMAAAASSSA